MGNPKHFSTKRASVDDPIHQQQWQQQSLSHPSACSRWVLWSPSSSRNKLLALLSPNPEPGPREWSHPLISTAIAKPCDFLASTQWYKGTRSSGFLPHPEYFSVPPQMAPIGLKQESQQHQKTKKTKITLQGLRS